MMGLFKTQTRRKAASLLSCQFQNCFDSSGAIGLVRSSCIVALSAQSKQVLGTHTCIHIELPRPSCPSPARLDQTQAPTSKKTPPSPHRLFYLQNSIDKLMHFLPQRFCPPQKRVL